MGITMLHLTRFLVLLLAVFLVLPLWSSNHASASAGKRIFVPIASAVGPANPFGFDVRSNIGDAVIPFVVKARPQWARAGDVVSS